MVVRFEKLKLRNCHLKFFVQLPGPEALPVSIVHCSHAFEFASLPGVELSACDKSVAHQRRRHDVGDDVLIDGRKQGVVKKLAGTEKARSKICRIEISKQILKLFKKCLDSKKVKFSAELRQILESNEPLRYCDFKAACKPNFFAGNRILTSFFRPAEIRSRRRIRLDGFLVRGQLPAASNNSNQKPRVLLLGGVLGEESNDFVEVLKKSGFEPKKVTVLKTEFCNGVIFQFTHLPLKF